MMRFPAFAAVLGVALALPVSAQTKWDMPTAYLPGNFHTENIQQFANDVDKATLGKLKTRMLKLAYAAVSVVLVSRRLSGAEMSSERPALISRLAFEASIVPAAPQMLRSDPISTFYTETGR